MNAQTAAVVEVLRAARGRIRDSWGQGVNGSYPRSQAWSLTWKVVEAVVADAAMSPPHVKAFTSLVMKDLLIVSERERKTGAIDDRSRMPATALRLFNRTIFRALEEGQE